jgi:hypothetical protein
VESRRSKTDSSCVRSQPDYKGFKHLTLLSPFFFSSSGNFTVQSSSAFFLSHCRKKKVAAVHLLFRAVGSITVYNGINSASFTPQKEQNTSIKALHASTPLIASWHIFISMSEASCTLNAQSH